jgi:hypothetical protein
MAAVIWLILTALLTVEAQSITRQNWTNHPSIVEIRQIANEVAGLIQKGSLAIDKKVFVGCTALSLERRMYSTSQGVVRFYQTLGGSDDSAYTFSHTYDRRGRLRFLFMQAGAVNGSLLEARYYFDSQGKLLWEQLKSSGPGYPFVDGKEAAVHDPRQALNQNPCRQ